MHVGEPCRKQGIAYVTVTCVYVGQTLIAVAAVRCEGRHFLMLYTHVVFHKGNSFFFLLCFLSALYWVSYRMNELALRLNTMIIGLGMRLVHE